MVEVFREVRRVLRKDGTLWLNLGDSYAAHGAGAAGKELAYMGDVIKGRIARVPPPGLKPKDLVGIPWMTAFALRADGWGLRQEIIWHKKNPMPESVQDRCTRAHEQIFMFSKNGKTILWRAKDTREWSRKPNREEILGYNEKGKPIKRWVGFSYWYDAEAVKEPGSTASIARLNQSSFDSQTGGPKDPLDGNRSCRKALVNLKKRLPSGWNDCPGDHRSLIGRFKHDKQRGHGRRHDGFNDRWDAMGKAEQCSMMVNLRSVWAIAAHPFPEAHFATFPPEIPERCIKAGCPKGGTVLDPFFGAGTMGLVALRLGREFIGIELSPAYCEMARKRIYGTLMEPE